VGLAAAEEVGVGTWPALTPASPSGAVGRAPARMAAMALSAPERGTRPLAPKPTLARDPAEPPAPAPATRRDLTASGPGFELVRPAPPGARNREATGGMGRAGTTGRTISGGSAVRAPPGCAMRAPCDAKGLPTPALALSGRLDCGGGSVSGAGGTQGVPEVSTSSSATGLAGGSKPRIGSASGETSRETSRSAFQRFDMPPLSAQTYAALSLSCPKLDSWSPTVPATIGRRYAAEGGCLI
jgi:hypothetical protein